MPAAKQTPAAEATKWAQYVNTRMHCGNIVLLHDFRAEKNLGFLAKTF